MKPTSIKQDVPRWLQLLQVSNPKVEIVVGDDKVWAMLPDEDNDCVTVITEECDGEVVRDLFEQVRDRYRTSRPQDVIGVAAKSTRPVKLSWYQVYSSSKWIDAETPIADLPSVEVQPYGDRQWAVMMDGALLCVCAYQRGATAVKRVISEMGRRFVLAKEQLTDCQMNYAVQRLTPGIY